MKCVNVISFHNLIFQNIYLNVFKPLEVTRKDFSILISKSKIHGFGPQESVYDAAGGGQILNVYSDLFILISGQMTAWCKGVPVHSIFPGDFINSVEWISTDGGGNQQNCKGQIMAYSDEDSTILKVCAISLNF